MILSKRQNGAGGVFVWREFMEGGVSKLAVSNSTQKSKHHVNTLEEYVLPFGAQIFEGFWEFQQNNASLHRS